MPWCATHRALWPMIRIEFEVIKLKARRKLLDSLFCFIFIPLRPAGSTRSRILLPSRLLFLVFLGSEIINSVMKGARELLEKTLMPFL